MKYFFYITLLFLTSVISQAQETLVKIQKINQSSNYYFIHGKATIEKRKKEILIISKKQINCYIKHKKEKIEKGKHYRFSLSKYVTEEEIKNIQASGSEAFIFLEDYPIWSNRNRFLTLKASDICSNLHLID